MNSYSHGRWSRVAVLSCFAVLCVLIFGAGYAGAANQGPPDMPPGIARGQAAINSLGDKLPEVAAAYGLSAVQLRNHFLNDHTLHVGPSGELFYVEDKFPGDDLASQAALATPAAAPFDLADTFTLHSLPGANHTIYLDFTGHTTVNTTWNSEFGIGTITSRPYDFDGNYASFSDAEKERIQIVWQIVSEDFRPFNIDVTTEEPSLDALTYQGGGDTKWGTRVVITDDDDGLCGCGGYAFIGSYDDSQDEPVFVYNKSLLGVAEASSHEVGHAMRLSHDGILSGATYYQGHGSGDTRWAPIMGASYYVNVSHWSKGEYYDSNNAGIDANYYGDGPDDLAIMASLSNGNGVGYRADDHGDSDGSASALAVSAGAVDDWGIIEKTADVDVFTFNTGAGTINLDITPFTPGSNLDVRARLYDSGGGQVASSDPASLLTASINTAVSAGTYTLHIDGVGVGSPLNSSPTGYTEYGSLGQYTISGSVVDSGSTGKYVVLLIGDGMGPEQVKAANYYNGGLLSFETLPFQADVTTYSADSSVTDSAAAATAMATGQKVNNGVISMASPGDGSDLETLLETFKSQGRSVGLVTTAYTTHATPAAFGAHEPSRNNLNEIAADYFGQTLPHVLFGGGANGMSTAAATSAGYAVVTDRTAMQGLNTETATMVSGQFGSSHLPYEFDGSYTTLPHLNEMTETALAILDNNTTDGFFLMVEAGRIDHAGHDNQLERNVQESLEFANTVQKVIDWVEDTGNDSSWANTLVVVTADHETGGMTVTQNNGAGNYPTVTWTTTGHSGVNVPVYASGLGADQITGATIDNTVIHALVLNQEPEEGVVDVQVGASLDDVEERASDGVVYTNSTDIELGDDPGYSEDQTVGLLFRNVTVPQGATIGAAYLEFTVDEVDTGTTDVTIWAQDADNAADFAATTNNVTNRATTTASAAWSIPAWSTAGASQQSPDLTAVVQEVVDRSGWSSGNKLAFIIDGSGSRTAEAYDGSAAGAAKLHIEYDTSPPPNVPPTASFTHSESDLMATFTDTSNDSDGTIASWSWDFGDGNTSTAQNPSYTYAAAGTYNVSLTVTDDDGATDSASQSVTVTAPGPANIEVMSWVPPYAIPQSQAAAQADFGACDAKDGLTRVGLQFWTPNTDGTIKYANHEWYTPTDADVAWWTNWGQANGIEILLTIYNNTGSWDWNLARSAFANNRATFVSALVSEMDRLNLDGIDLDLEGIGSFDSDRAAFDQFVHDLWVELDARGKILAIDSFHYIWNAPNHNWWSDWVGEVDKIHSMGYDDLFEGGTLYQPYSYQQNAGYAAGYAGDDVLMGMPGWLASWGTSSGRGTSAQAHVQEVRYDLTEPTGIAIWDIQLSQWQDSDLWCEIEALKELGTSNNTPVADFTFVTNDLMADFTDASFDSDGTVVSWSWDFGDGNTSTAQNPSHSYAAGGTYSVSLTVTDDDGATDNTSQDVTVTAPNVAPTADFTFVTTDLTADFSDASSDSDGTVVGWSWDFGDGNTSTAQNPSHSYAAAGTYNVTLTVTDDDGATGNTNQNVTVTAPNVAPTADFTFVTTDLTADFTDASGDTDGSVVGWSWDFGDGNGSTERNPSHTYDTAGTYNVSLTVTDDDGATDNTSQNVTVSEPPPFNDYMAVGEIFVSGTVSGNYVDTQAEDDVAESITERESGGKPQNRHTYLEHKWTFNVPSGGTSTTFYANVWAPESDDGDNFKFFYSIDDASYVEMFTVAATSDDDSYQTYDLTGLSGTIYIQVVDTDSTSGHRAKDTIYVDHIFIRTDNTPVVPPAAPTSLSITAVTGSSIDLSWVDNADNELGFTIERSLNGVDWSQIDSVGADVTAYSDTGLDAETTYYYQVRALNSGGESGYSNCASATTDMVVIENMHVSAIDASSEPGNKNRWNATVTITVVDDNDNPVSNATVVYAWSNGLSGSGACVTDSAGQCSVTKINIKSNVSSATFTVTDVQHATYVYSSGDNVVTSVDVSKP